MVFQTINKKNLELGSSGGFFFNNTGIFVKQNGSLKNIVN